LDLHRFRAPSEAHVAFWEAVAKQYANHPAVLFELFNEPHDLSWELWRNGGEVTDKVPPKEGVVSESKEELKRLQTVGMQRLLEAVRGTGARNLVIAGGLDWSYDLSGVLKGFALTEPGGNGIAYSTHIYPWKKGWQEHFLEVAAKYPIFIGEVGAIRAWEDFTFIGPDQRYALDGWAEDVLAMIQANKLNWTGFSFHPKCGPMVILDWDYTPTPYWGVYVKDALAGKIFELKKLR
jgi:endoglucanase